MTLREHQVKFSQDFFKLQQYLKDNGYEWTYGEALRTEYQQQYYFDHGLSKTMDSYHRKKLAIDLNIFKDGSYLQNKEFLQHIGDYWESLDPINKWGGNFKGFTDTPHFERRGKV